MALPAFAADNRRPNLGMDRVGNAGGQVVLYDATDFKGRAEVLERSWSGGGYWDQRIQSMRVPRGCRVTIYQERNYQGTQARLTENWNPGPTAAWVGRIRSIRIEWDDDGSRPPPSGSFPVIYAQRGYQGPAMAVERDQPELRDWDGSPHSIRSIRVPSGWRLVVYEHPNYGGRSQTLTSNWSPPTNNMWSGLVRSIRVYGPGDQDRPPVSGSYPVIYAQRGYSGPAMAVERDQPELRDWDGSPHSIRSIRVPEGWRLIIYEQPEYRGRSETLTSNWSPSSSDWWSGRVRSIRVYRDNPLIQPR
jgi:hypothetical protein